MIGIVIFRISFWLNRYDQAWLSANIQWDYYHVNGAISLATIELSFNYIWKESRHDLKKSDFGWEWEKHAT